MVILGGWNIYGDSERVSEHWLFLGKDVYGGSERLVHIGYSWGGVYGGSERLVLVGNE